MVGIPWDDGLTYNYATEQMVKMIWSLSVISFVVFGMLVLLLLFQRFIRKTQPPRNSLGSQEELLLSEMSQPPQPPAFDVFYFCNSVLFYGLVVIATLMIGVLHGFQRLGTTTLAKAMTALVTVLVGILLHVLWKFLNSDKKRQFHRGVFGISGTRLVAIFVALIIWVTFVGLLMFVSNGICYCIYNDNLGPMSSSTGLSTSLTRRLYLEKKICQDQSFCRLFATLPETTNTSVFINVHTGTKVDQVKISMTEFNGKHNNQQPTDQQMFVTDFNEEYGKRKVWTYLFTNLKPNTLYNLSLTNEHNKTMATTYKTLSNLNDNVSSMKVVVGGDVGLSDHGRTIFRNIGELNPDLIVIGGDIAYDNAMTYCYFAWDNFYLLLQRVDEANNRLVPFILALGNHDIGHNSYARVAHTKPSHRGPWYFTYNPQHFAQNTTSKIPEVSSRKSYGYHIIGQSVLVTLDSQYSQSYQQQAVYAEEISSRFRSQGYALFGLYHVPLYPSCYHPSHFQSPEALNDSHTYYQPVFVKYNYTMCFENHVHKLKRTLPIDGVVYIGDGNMGVDEEPCTQGNQIYRDKMAKTMFEGSNHYWIVDWGRESIGLKAVTLNHTIVDQTVVKIR